MQTVNLLLIGLVAGVASGMFGIGGGLIIVPALMYWMGLGMVPAIATSLAALIPPVGLLGAVEYYRNGQINVRFAGLIALGLFIGAYFGARIVLSLPGAHLKRAYACFLIAVAVRMLVSGK